jgi:4-hydroxymandelate oxidase
VDLGRLEEEARALLPPGSYDYIAGGAGDETTLADSVAAWDRLRLRPRVLRDVSAVSTETTVLGEPVSMPVLVAPTAFHRMVHPDGEPATARGTAEAGTLMTMSTRSTSSIDAVASAAPDAPRWFQVYVVTDRDQTARSVCRAAELGFRALVLTGDTPLLGRRLRDVRNQFELPDEVVAAFEATDLPHTLDQDRGVTVEQIGWLRDLTGLPVLVKGVLRGDDAVACLEAGASGVVVSNHGGRQLDGAVASADALPEVVEAVAGRAEVFVDGGVRRGVDVVRALALGARAVLVGRPVLWALATGGADGVARLLRTLRAELELAMALCGAARVEEITDDLVVRT